MRRSQLSEQWESALHRRRSGAQPPRRQVTGQVCAESVANVAKHLIKGGEEARLVELRELHASVTRRMSDPRRKAAEGRGASRLASHVQGE